MKKRFINPGLMDLVQSDVETRIAQMEWMKDREFLLAKNVQEVSNFIDKAIAVGVCSLDLETNTLNTRVKITENAKIPIGKIVGFCLCFDSKVGLYVPINHRVESEYNLPEAEILPEINRLVRNCVTIYHNAKFDLLFLRNYGIIVRDADKIDDTLLMAYLYDSGRKNNKLKELAPDLINQPMLKFEEVAKDGRFDFVSPRVAYVYGASDPVCTYDLYGFFKKQKIFTEQYFIYNLEKRLIFVVMDMESNLVKINVPYLTDLKNKIETRIAEIKNEVYAIIGYEFNLASSKQLGKILFEDLKYKYPEKTKTKSEQYSTNEKTLEKIADLYPIVKKILEFRGLEKCLNTYINNLLNNHDENDCVKLNFKQTGTDTGRFASPGGKGIDIDGSAMVNIQATPKMPDEENPWIDMREAFIARPGMILVAIDYANEEMRVATNISNETAWIDSLNKGIDFHTSTGAIIYGKSYENVTKAERKVAKTVNFLALYLGGAYTLAGNAKIPVAEAKKILATFFAGVPKLKRWIDAEIKNARKLKYVKTMFGRTRPLAKYYESGDKGLEAHADRCAVNTRIQGCLHKEERCLTTEGYLPIIKIKELKELGKDLKVWTGTSWEGFDVFDRGEAQLAEIELENGMVLHCDTRHEVLTVSDSGYEFTKFDELTEKTNICISRPRLLEFGSYPEKITLEGNAQKLKVSTTEEWHFIAYLLGCVIGDGSIFIDKKISKYVITLNFGEEKIKNIFPNLKKRLNDLGLKISEPVLNKGSKGICYRTNICSVTLIRLFEKMGYLSHNAYDKRIPQQIMESPVKMRLSFLRGYFDTDGCKKEANRYYFHTPNKDLLREIQLLAWTIGCFSTIHDCNDGSFMLNWMNYRIFAELMGLSFKKEKRKCNTCNMSLPDFLRGPVLYSLGNCYVKSAPDRSYVCKIRNGKNVSLPGVVSLLNNYNCDLPEIYYYSKLKKKTILDKKEVTYTLSVHSSLHRFDSAGIISKNTSADIMKIVMVKLDNWFRENNLSDEIKILITMHDELVFEMPAEKIKLYVPEICKIMQAKNIISERLKWPIPLDVDVKYGNSWRVKHDFFKDFPELKEELKNPLKNFKDLHKKDNYSPPLKCEEDKKEIQVVESNKVVGTLNRAQDIEKESQDIVVEQKNESITDRQVEKVKVKKNDSSSGTYFVYTLRNLSTTTLRWLNDILVFLNEEAKNKNDKVKKILRIKDIQGNNLLVSEFKVDIEGFLILVKFFGI